MPEVPIDFRMSDPSPDKQRAIGESTRAKEVLLGLQCRATVLVVGVTLAVSLAACLFLFKATTNFFEEQHTEETLRLADTVALAAAPYFESEDPAHLKELAREVSERDPILSVRFFSRDGRPIAWHRRAQCQIPDVTVAWQLGATDIPIGVSQFYPAQAESPAFAGIVYPVRRLESIVGGGDGVLGYVHIATSLEAFGLWTRQTVNFLTGVGLIVVLISMPLSYLAVRRLVRPINALCEAMAAFSSGYLDVRSRVDRRDEIGKLSATFNLMADQHQRAHESLIQLNNELERRVARRTKLLRHLATRDSLTGLHNRRYFDEMLRRRFAEAERYGHVISCMMIDVDDFKTVNDRLGHAEGDRRLVLAASVIRRQMRVSDVGARFGGDEFVILLPHTDREQAKTLARRISAELIAAQHENNVECPTTLSIGVADTIALEPRDAERLLQAADQALYDAKNTGKNRVESAPMPARLQEA
ncbi:MAG: hypothetical protein AMXMBFR22_07910 [Phycisphaerae bacterium]